MAIKTKNALKVMLLGAGIILLLILIMQPLLVHHFRDFIDLLFPAGTIGLEERNLLLIIQAIMLIVVIPVYILTFFFSWRYSAHNPKGKYDPDLVDNPLAEYIWWGLPLVMTAIVAILTFVKTYELDPFKPIESNKKPIAIQVVALQWKWLFLYPEEQIASLNFLQFPKDTPIHFEITSDAPMNSFWIPKLGGQIYAMPSMKTELHLIANQTGEFRGLSANLSGEGFAAMHFITKVSSEEEYKNWLDSAKKSSNNLNSDAYNKLAVPSQNNAPEVYRLQDTNLFNQIVAKFMQPQKK